jgi:hypothetical protein
MDSAAGLGIVVVRRYIGKLIYQNKSDLNQCLNIILILGLKKLLMPLMLFFF